MDIFKTNLSVQYTIIYKNNRCKDQYSWIFFRQTRPYSTKLLFKTSTDAKSSTVGYSLDKQVRVVQNYYSKQQQMQREVQDSTDIF